jgi:hypothetical protein
VHPRLLILLEVPLAPPPADRARTPNGPGGGSGECLGLEDYNPNSSVVKILVEVASLATLQIAQVRDVNTLAGLAHYFLDEIRVAPQLALPAFTHARDIRDVATASVEPGPGQSQSVSVTWRSACLKVKWRDGSSVCRSPCYLRV